MTAYDLERLYEAYYEACGDGNYAAWSLFEDEYGEDATRDFLEAVNDGHIEVFETKHGIRADGHWPRYNVGRLWLDFDFSDWEADA